MFLSDGIEMASDASTPIRSFLLPRLGLALREHCISSAAVSDPCGSPTAVRKTFSMRIFAVLLAAFVAATSSVSAAELPSGRIVEVHSIEVYTGGCTASAQATMGGRSMLRVWSFEDGVELKGLQIAALQVADKNLAFADTQPTSAVVYLPRKALLTRSADEAVEGGEPGTSERADDPACFAVPFKNPSCLRGQVVKNELLAKKRHTVSLSQISEIHKSIIICEISGIMSPNYDSKGR